MLLIAGSSLCTAQDVTFRSDSQLVLTSLHVTAKKQYVNGLTRADFELLVDGRARPITTFENPGKPGKGSLIYESIIKTGGAARTAQLADIAAYPLVGEMKLAGGERTAVY